MRFEFLFERGSIAALFCAFIASPAVALGDLYVDQSNPSCPGSGTDTRFVEAHNGDYHIRHDSPVRGQADDGSDLGAYPLGS